MKIAMAFLIVCFYGLAAALGIAALRGVYLKVVVEADTMTLNIFIAGAICCCGVLISSAIMVLIDLFSD